MNKNGCTMSRLTRLTRSSGKAGFQTRKHSIARLALILAIVGILVGCAGGGTNGTGIEARAVVLTGHARFNNQAIPIGLTITHEESGQTSAVDQTGAFGFVLEIEGTAGFSLSYSYSGEVFGVSTASLPAESTAVDVSIVIDAASGRPSAYSATPSIPPAGSKNLEVIP